MASILHRLWISTFRHFGYSQNKTVNEIVSTSSAQQFHFKTQSQRLTRKAQRLNIRSLWLYVTPNFGLFPGCAEQNWQGSSTGYHVCLKGRDPQCLLVGSVSGFHVSVGTGVFVVVQYGCLRVLVQCISLRSKNSWMNCFKNIRACTSRSVIILNSTFLGQVLGKYRGKKRALR